LEQREYRTTTASKKPAGTLPLKVANHISMYRDMKQGIQLDTTKEKRKRNTSKDRWTQT
jgi:hypothetical protein